MIGVRVFELAHDKDRDVRENTTLAYVSNEVLKLAEMVTKFDESMKRWSSVEACVGGSHLPPVDDSIKDESEPEPEPILPPLPDNENLPTLSWAVPAPWGHAAAKESTSTNDDSKAVSTTGSEVEGSGKSLYVSGKNLRKGFKFLFGTLDPSGSAEPDEQVDIAEEATTATVEESNEKDGEENSSSSAASKDTEGTDSQIN